MTRPALRLSDVIRILHQGHLDQVVTEEHLSEAFGLRLTLERHGHRWSARAI